MSGASTHSGRFWSGAGVGLGTGLGASLCLGWWLSQAPIASDAPAASVPDTAAASSASSLPHDARPATAKAPRGTATFEPPTGRLADAGDLTPDRPQEAPPAAVAANMAAPTALAQPEAVAATASSPAVAAPAVAPEALQAPEALPLRDRFDSLSDALLTEPPAHTSSALQSAAPASRSQDGESPSPPSADPWIDVWQPFISPVSARGFADRLELLTGFTYRVERRDGDGLHQVAVQPLEGYAPQQMLEQIAARSGLALVSSP